MQAYIIQHDIAICQDDNFQILTFQNSNGCMSFRGAGINCIIITIRRSLGPVNLARYEIFLLFYNTIIIIYI